MFIGIIVVVLDERLFDEVFLAELEVIVKGEVSVKVESEEDVREDELKDVGGFGLVGDDGG
jgi:hypothetical protein